MVKMRKEILVPGVGWICAGIISIAVWNLRPGSTGLLYIGLLAAAVGIALLALNKSLSKIIDKYKSRKN